MQSRLLEASSPEIELVAHQKPYIVHCTNRLFVLQTTLAIGLANCYSAREGGKEKSGATSVSCFFFLSPPSSSPLPPKAQTVNRTPETPPLSFLFCFFPASLFGSSVSLFGVWEQRGCNGMRKRGGGGKEDLTAFFPRFGNA